MLENEDRRTYRVSFEKIHKQLGFSCSKTLAYGIQEIYRAIRAGQITDFTTAQFNNQIALRALVRAGAKQSSPLHRVIARVSMPRRQNDSFEGDLVRTRVVGL